MKKLLLLGVLLFCSILCPAQTFDFLPTNWKKLENITQFKFNQKEVQGYTEHGELIDNDALGEYLQNQTYVPVFYVNVDEEIKGIVFIERKGKQSTVAQPVIKLPKSSKDRNNSFIGKTAPDFELTTLEGKEVRLSDYAGRFVLLNFWFTSCAPCIQEIPELNQLVEKYRDKGVVFLAIGLDNPERIKDFLKKHPFSYNILPNGLRVARSFKVSSYPTHLLLNPEKEVVYSQVGYFSGLMHSLEIALNKLLELK